MAKTSVSERAIQILNPKAGLFDQCREVLRIHHYALRTEKAHLPASLSWIA
jgi:hypothetical protein